MATASPRRWRPFRRYSPISRAGAAGGAVPRHFFGLSVRDARRRRSPQRLPGRHQKRAISAFALAFLAYNFKCLWAPLVDRDQAAGASAASASGAAGCGWPASGRWRGRVLGARRSGQDISRSWSAPSLLGFAGATFDIVIDAYRIELLEPRQLGVGSGMSQYGWRSARLRRRRIALFVAARSGWTAAISRAPRFALPARSLVAVHGRARAAPRAQAGPGRTRAARRLLGPARANSSGARARWSCCCSC